MRECFKGILILSIVLISRTGALSQLYGNEWIDYNKSYYKISVADEGIYRLEFQDLVDAGIPVNAIDGRKYQIFHRGVEQAIFEQNTGAVQLESGDFLEFYGNRNDGTLDSLLYEPYSAQPHKYYNLYSDSTAFFLTWLTSTQDGKRMSFFQEANVSAIPVQTSHSEELLEVYTLNYSQGTTVNSYAAKSAFDIGEGWTSTRIQENNSSDFVISNIINQLQIDGLPQLELLIVGRNDQDHDMRVLAGPNVSGLRDIGTFSFSNYDTQLINETLNWSDISVSGDLTIRIEVLDNGTPLSNISPSYVKVNFPQLWDMNSEPQKTFTSVPDPGDKSYIEIINTPTNARMYDVTDPDNVKSIGYSGNLNEIKAIIPNTITARKLFVTTPTPVIANTFLKKVNFRNVDPANHNYVIISHPALMGPAGAYQNAVKAFSDYRASTEGGNYDTLVVSILDLFNQYGYGESTPLSIYNFMRRMVDQGDPEYLFIIGKALNVNYDYYRKDPSSFAFPEYVPTGGYPGSDIIFTAGLDGAGLEPRVATGRIPAISPKDVVDYFEKVKVKESQPFNDLWFKRLLHLSGGTSALEKVQFENIVKGFEAIAEDVFLGGSVSTITKNTSSAVEFINISDAVNDGLLFITFFGHSAPGITDIDIGEVSNPALGYDNKDRYPMFLVNGCEAGDFFEDYKNWGTDWLLTPDKGAVGFVAHSSFGFVNRLKFYSDNFYEAGFGDSLFIPRPVGVIQTEAAKRFQNGTSDTYINTAQVQQMVYMGDPATRLFGTNQPDYQTEDVNLFAIAPEESPITSLTEEFELGIITKNYGAAISDSVEIAVTRTFPDGSVFQYDTLIYPGVNIQDTLVFPVSNNFENNAGLNRFEVQIDPDQKIAELDETNNSGILNLAIPLNGTINLQPLNYGIINDVQIRIVVQAADLLSESRTFIVELDSSAGFDSPFKQAKLIDAKEIAEWQVVIPDIDSLVIYWRSKYTEPKPGEEEEWETSSFTYIDNSPEGWSQIDFPQFENSLLNGIEADTVNKVWKFEENEINLHIKTFGTDNPDFDFNDVEVEIDGLRYIFASRLCRDNTINGIAFDNFTAAPYAALFEEIFSPRTCGRQVQVINNYTDAEVLGADNYLVNYIDAVKNKDQVVLFSIGTVSYSSWTQDIWDKMAEIGVDQVDLQVLNDGDPAIILGRKGDPIGSALIVTADYASIDPAGEQEISLDQVVTGKYSEGTISSTKIGPALSWSDLFTEVKSEDGPGVDEFLFDIIGIQSNGNEVDLFNDLSAGSTDISSIDALTYPELRLRGIFRDETNLTVPQLNKWLVTYEYPPDGILLFSSTELPVPVQEGESDYPQFLFVNLTDKDFASDSLDVNYSLFNLTTRSLDAFVMKIGSPGARDTIPFQLDINTVGRQGLNDLSILVNPLELEQTIGNNYISIESYLNVEPDRTNPLVDVTIDGEHIFDGDIVSPSPLINIEVRDDNPYLSLNDTTIVDLFVQRPCEGCVIERISYSDPTVSWQAADQKDPFTLVYNPQNLENGIHTIEVQAKDATGNIAGEEPYRINFEIVNESTITHFYPYPNPFSSSTRFVFTLTGSQIPDQIKIQIMTISGKVVREITQDELGPLRIGNNLSEFAWDGHDEFGDQLANGVYLYRVVARINGEELDLRETSGDSAFKNGIGKLYLLR
jgi:hypothetical protein